MLIFLSSQRTQSKSMKYIMPEQLLSGNSSQENESISYTRPFLVLDSWKKDVLIQHKTLVASACILQGIRSESFKCQLLPLYIKDKACKWSLNASAVDNHCKSQTIKAILNISHSSFPLQRVSGFNFPISTEA